ncbi:MAG: response regulator [Actinobacteria bacterium]|jgi:CheY-like chemotaxis protein|nr:MAG: response regulator [Actinomycetota bacterium]
MNRTGQTILLVEDDPNDVILIERAFENVKIANPIHVVEDGEKAISYLESFSPRGERKGSPLPMLILLDLKLPRKSGLEVLEWLREQPYLRRLPVVVLTSSRESSDINRAYDNGANSYLVKPGSFEDLLTMVESLNMYWVILNERPEIGAETDG